MKQPGFKRRMIRLQSRVESFQCGSASSAGKAKPQAQAQARSMVEARE